MPTRSSRLFLVAVTLLSFHAIEPAAVAAQSGGPYAPVVLTLPTGPRTLAMGNVGIGSRDDEVLFFNPAQIAVARGMSASAERYSASAGGGTLASVTRLGNGGVAVGMRMADYRFGLAGFPSDRNVMLGGGADAGTSLEATAALAQVIKGIRVGVAAKYAEDQAMNVRNHRAAADIGLAKDFKRYFTAGLAVQNVASSISFSPITAYLPLRTTAGVAGSGPVGPLDVTATAAVSLLRDSFVIPAGGGEVSYSWLDGYAIAIRAGVRRPIPGEAPFTAGAGFTMDRLSIDYAIEALSGSRAGHRIGLRIR